MRGWAVHVEDPAPEPGNLESWRSRAVEALGAATEFWGFKRNHGRVWSLLYLEDRALTAHQIQDALDLSKGAVSMITRELETWGVIHRMREPGDASWHFVAETDLMSMVRRVVEEREASMVARVRADLAEAEREAAEDPDAPEGARERLGRLRHLSERSERVMRLFLKTSRLDAGSLVGILKGNRSGE